MAGGDRECSPPILDPRAPGQSGHPAGSRSGRRQEPAGPRAGSRRGAQAPFGAVRRPGDSSSQPIDTSFLNSECRGFSRPALPAPSNPPEGPGCNKAGRRGRNKAPLGCCAPLDFWRVPRNTELRPSCAPCCANAPVCLCRSRGLKGCCAIVALRCCVVSPVVACCASFRTQRATGRRRGNKM